MKTIKKRLNPIAFLLTALLLFQSCVVYHKTPTTLEKASQERIKTKVVKANGETAKYTYITYEDGQYFGMHLKSGEWVKSPLDKYVVAEVFAKNKSASTLLTIGLVIAVPLGIAFIIYASDDKAFVGI